MDQQPARAEHGVDELRSSRNDRWYPSFHITAPAGWINDPNGLSYFKGRYHVYFQHHPYTSDWGLMHWGHVSSADMVTWRHEPIALAPSTEEDRDGVFSGSAVVSGDDELLVYYTGHRWRNGVNEDEGSLQVQCMAVSDDGISFDKQGVVIDCPENLLHFRDPKVWRMRDRGYMTVGACSSDNRGEIWLYTSENMRNWEFDRVLYRDPDPQTFMVECPDLFPLGDKWVLTFCPMGPEPRQYLGRNTHNAGYIVGNWSPGEEFHRLTDYRPMDWGANYYAPQSFQAPDGRRIALAWMGSFGIPPASQITDGWSGQLTVHRELTLSADNRLLAQPIDELTKLRLTSQDFGAVTLGPNELRVLAENIDAAEVEMEVDLTESTAERVGLAVNKTPDGHETLVGYDDLAQRVFVDRRNSGHGDRGYRAAPCPTGPVRLRVFIDRGSVEVFVNDGAETVSSLIFAADGPRSIELYTESGVATIRRLVVHRLGTIWDGAR
ncbi:glycoside hydrolase family 32 protein [Mycobacterium aquaticum]|uniref:Sucrose-6-phosphate hydrolase n=1 Tax=Mycobacterium aquaticum TaxID=1927124 RepID=A0A1X0B4D6_9MYCO|nr:glycoside hydrolase family 32 protein [Mycobacterium aquaticum]ORA37204.1 beta-(1-2)-fructofuranosidase [Mycobacterium aquaticum]